MMEGLILNFKSIIFRKTNCNNKNLNKNIQYNKTMVKEKKLVKINKATKGKFIT